MPVILHHGPPAPPLPFRERVQRSRMEGCLVIVPTKRRVRHLTREIMRLAPGAVAPALPLHTLESFCRSVYAGIPGTLPLLAGPPRSLMFLAAVKSVADSLRYFSTRGEERLLSRGTFDRVVEVVTRLKETGIYPGALQEELSASSPEEQPKLADVAALYAAYERQLELLGVEDLEGIYRFLAGGCSQQQFAGSFRRLFPDVEMLSLAGFDEFSFPEINILRKVCALPGVSVTMMFDFLRGNKDLFGHLEENYRLLTELGFREVRGNAEAESSAFFFGTENRQPHARAAAEHLAKTLFLRESKPVANDLTSSVTVMAARSRVHEVELICMLIKGLVSDRPTRELSGICVALRHPQTYTEIVRELFARHGIPVNITDRYELARSPVVVTLLGVLQIPLHGFQRVDVLRVAGSPYLHVPTDGYPFDPGNLAAVASRIRATAGVTAWRAKIDRALHEAQVVSHGTDDPTAERRSADDVRGLQQARSDLDALERVVSPFTGELTPAEFEERVLVLIERLGVARALVDPRLRQRPDLMEKDVRAYTAFLDVLRDVTAMAEIQQGARAPLRIHLDRLKVAVSQERYNVREQFGRGVLVTSIEETRELPVDVMIVAGLVDGEFPSVYQPEVFLSARRRKKREQRYTWENRYLFYQAVTNWTEHLYLTYPLRDGEAELVPSSFIDAMRRSADMERWEKPGEVPFADDMCSREEFFRRYSVAALAEPLSLPVPPGLEVESARVRFAGSVERSRTLDHSLKAHEGQIFDDLNDAERGVLSNYRDRVLSVSQLETYAQCPFRFLAGVVLHLRDVGEFEERLTAAEKGSVLHAVLYEFFTRRRDIGSPPIQTLSHGMFEEALAELTEIAHRHLDALDIPDVFWEIEKELILGRDPSGDGLLRRFLETERQRGDGMTPAYFEVSFGGTPGYRGMSDPLLSRPEPVTFGSIRLRGKIDRVEIGGGEFTVVDYKTGRTLSSLEEIRDGFSFQLPVYLHAAEELLRTSGQHDLAPAGGVYYQLLKDVKMVPGVVTSEYRQKAFPKSARPRQVVDDDKALRAVILGSAGVAATYVENIAAGEFPLTRPELVARVCTYCTFKTICRIQALRHVSPGEAEGE